MSKQRQHILLGYFKTLSVGPVLGLNLWLPPAGYSGVPRPQHELHELNKRGLFLTRELVAESPEEIII